MHGRTGWGPASFESKYAVEQQGLRHRKHTSRNSSVSLRSSGKSHRLSTPQLALCLTLCVVVYLTVLYFSQDITEFADMAQTHWPSHSPSYLRSYLSKAKPTSAPVVEKGVGNKTVHGAAQAHQTNESLSFDAVNGTDDEIAYSKLPPEAMHQELTDQADTQETAYIVNGTELLADQANHVADNGTAKIVDQHPNQIPLGANAVPDLRHDDPVDENDPAYIPDHREQEHETLDANDTAFDANVHGVDHAKPEDSTEIMLSEPVDGYHEEALSDSSTLYPRPTAPHYPKDETR